MQGRKSFPFPTGAGGGQAPLRRAGSAFQFVPDPGHGAKSPTKRHVLLGPSLVHLQAARREMHSACVSRLDEDTAFLHVIELQRELSFAESGDLARAMQFGMEVESGQVRNEVEERDVGHAVYDVRNDLYVRSLLGQTHFFSL